LKKKKKNLSVLIFFFILIIIILITRDYSVKFPEELLKTAETYNIFVKEADVKTNFFPLPQFKIDKLEFKYKNNHEFVFDNITLNLDIIDLIINKQQKISSIEVKEFTLRVLDTPESIDYISQPYTTVEMIMEEVSRLTSLIPQQFNLTKWLEVNKFNLFIDSISKEKPLLTVNDFFLKKQEYLKPYIVIHSDYNLGEWIHGDVNIDVWKNGEENNNWLKLVEIYVNSNCDLNKLIKTFPQMSLLLKGKASSNHFISMQFPLKRLLHSHYIKVNKFSVADAKNPEYSYIDIKPIKPLEIRAGGYADIDTLKLQQFNIYLDETIISAEADWKYKDFLFGLQFIPNSQIPWNTASKYLGTFVPLKTTEHFKIMNGFIVPVKLTYNPWEQKLFYEFYSSVNIPIISESAKMNKEKKFNLQGYYWGSETGVKSSDVYLESNFMRLIVHDMKTSFKENLTITGDMESQLFLNNMIDGSLGTLQLQTRLDCVIKGIQCKKETFRLEGANLKIPANTAIKFYRFLNINILAHLKRPFESGKHITIETALFRGYLKDSKFFIEEGLIKSSGIGEFRLSGTFNPFEGKGKLNLRFLPFHIEQILDPIPIVGTAIKKGLDFTSLNFHITILNMEPSLEIFSGPSKTSN